MSPTSTASHGEVDRLARTEAVAGHGAAAFEPPATMGQPGGRAWHAHLPLNPLLQHADVVRGKQAIHRPGLREADEHLETLEGTREGIERCV